MKVVFDLESDGLLHQLTKIHCIGHYDLDERSGVVSLAHTDQDIEECVRMLQDADEIIGHNIIAFDIPALASAIEANPDSCCVHNVFFSKWSSRHHQNSFPLSSQIGKSLYC